MVNVSGSSYVSTINSYSTVSENISDENTQKLQAEVTEIKAHHLPTEAQCRERAKLLKAILETKGQVARQPLCHEIKEKVEQLYEKREATFSIVNQGTCDVYGKLAEGKTENDRDSYVRDLLDFRQLEKEIASLIESEEISRPDIVKLFYCHHSTRLYGDLRQVARYENNKDYNIPDLTYNQSDMQFG